MGPSTITVGDFSVLLSSTDVSSRQINRETSELPCSLDQMDLEGIYRIFHPATANTYSFQEVMDFSKTGCISGHKANLKYKKLK
jgi:hypothetical protein